MFGFKIFVTGRVQFDCPRRQVIGFGGRRFPAPASNGRLRQPSEFMPDRFEARSRRTRSLTSSTFSGVQGASFSRRSESKVCPVLIILQTTLRSRSATLVGGRSAGRAVAGAVGAIFFEQPNSACAVFGWLPRGCAFSPAWIPSFKFPARLFSLNFTG